MSEAPRILSDFMINKNIPVDSASYDQDGNIVVTFASDFSSFGLAIDDYWSILRKIRSVLGFSTFDSYKMRTSNGTLYSKAYMRIKCISDYVEPGISEDKDKFIAANLNRFICV